jgi:hypothetical protein
MVDLTGKVTVKVVLYEVLGDGDVIVYKVEKGVDNLKFEDFYIATFDDVRSEVVWGLGSTPFEALKDAEMKWDRKEGDEDNPFREVLEMFREALDVLKEENN